MNLPVEFDASNRAKRQLVQLGIVDAQGLVHVRSVLNAAAWTYVAGTLQSVMTLLYYSRRFSPAAAATESSSREAGRRCAGPVFTGAESPGVLQRQPGAVFVGCWRRIAG